MEKHALSDNAALQDTNDVSYHDEVDHFDLHYKITPPTEKIDSLIHYHECFELIFYINANIEVYLDDLHYTLNAHDVLIIPPMKIHKIIYPTGQNYIRYVFYFTQEHIENAFPPMLTRKALHRFKDQGHYKASLSAPEYLRLNNVFHNMHEHKQETPAGSSYLLTSYASVILQELYIIFKNHPREDPNSREPSPVEQILRYINEHYSEKITLRDLEEKFYLNRSYICRIFRKTMGLSLVNYLQYKRIVEAQQLLLYSDKSIIDISMECGFGNMQHFYRVFKKVTNMTPKEYQRHPLSTKLGQSISIASHR